MKCTDCEHFEDDDGFLSCEAELDYDLTKVPGMTWARVLEIDIALGHVQKHYSEGSFEEHKHFWDPNDDIECPSYAVRQADVT